MASALKDRLVITDHPSHMHKFIRQNNVEALPFNVAIQQSAHVEIEPVAYFLGSMIPLLGPEVRCLWPRNSNVNNVFQAMGFQNVCCMSQPGLEFDEGLQLAKSLEDQKAGQVTLSLVFDANRWNLLKLDKAPIGFGIMLVFGDIRVIPWRRARDLERAVHVLNKG